MRGARRFNDWFGSAADGNVTIGVGTTSLTQDMYYDTLIVPSGAVLFANGFTISARTKIWVQTGGRIHNNSGNATGAVLGTQAGGTPATSTKPISAGGPGGDGGTGAPTIGQQQINQPGHSITNVSRGGNGGKNSAGQAGGGAGNATVSKAAYTMPLVFDGRVSSTSVLIPGGSGGGAGNGNGVGNLSGAGGNGGGVVLLRAPIIQIDGIVEAKGGNAGDAAGTGSGGGGGGGGGKVVLTALRGGISGQANCDVSPGTFGHLSAGGAATDGVGGTAGAVIVRYLD